MFVKRIIFLLYISLLLQAGCFAQAGQENRMKETMSTLIRLLKEGDTAAIMQMTDTEIIETARIEKPGYFFQRNAESIAEGKLISKLVNTEAEKLVESSRFTPNGDGLVVADCNLYEGGDSLLNIKSLTLSVVFYSGEKFNANNGKFLYYRIEKEPLRRSYKIDPMPVRKQPVQVRQ